MRISTLTLLSLGVLAGLSVFGWWVSAAEVVKVRAVETVPLFDPNSLAGQIGDAPHQLGELAVGQELSVVSCNAPIGNPTSTSWPHIKTRWLQLASGKQRFNCCVGLRSLGSKELLLPVRGSIRVFPYMPNPSLKRTGLRPSAYLVR